MTSLAPESLIARASAAIHGTRSSSVTANPPSSARCSREDENHLPRKTATQGAEPLRFQPCYSAAAHAHENEKHAYTSSNDSDRRRIRRGHASASYSLKAGLALGEQDATVVNPIASTKTSSPSSAPYCRGARRAARPFFSVIDFTIDGFSANTAASSATAVKLGQEKPPPHFSDFAFVGDFAKATQHELMPWTPCGPCRSRADRPSSNSSSYRTRTRSLPNAARLAAGPACATRARMRIDKGRLAPSRS